MGRAALCDCERQQVARLSASCGALIAARMLGIDFATLKAAVAGALINPSTRTAMLTSGWLKECTHE